MGWFSSSPSSSSSTGSNPAPEPSRDGGFIAPDRSQRAICWEARDSFFQCLDRAEIIDSVKESDKAAKACAPELKEFEKACASSWVTYFKKRRVFEYQRDLTLKKLSEEGAQPLPGSSTATTASALRGDRR